MGMRIVPVIDIRDGRAVAGRSADRARYAPVMSRLRGGMIEDLSEPRALARAFARALGSERIYVADLDRIERAGDNDATLLAILDDHPALTVLWDGGFAATTAAPARPRLAPIVASESLAAPALDLPTPGTEPAWLGLDLEAGGLRARSHAVAALDETDLLARGLEAGVGGCVVVHLGGIGTGTGLPRERLSRLRRAAPDLPMIAGGGIATLDDLLFMRAAGFQGALVATALHDGRLRAADLRAAGMA
jgi:phosphoribosylformimino-5-aminoimidazole carboxamide ribotide isomerase